MVKRKPQRGEETIKTEQEVGYHIEIVTVMGGMQVGGKGVGTMSVQSMGEIGNGFFPNVLQTFLEIIVRRSCDDGGSELIQLIHNPHQKRPALSFSGGFYHGVPCRGAL